MTTAVVNSVSTHMPASKCASRYRDAEEVTHC
jgi:hypothetical protein